MKIKRFKIKRMNINKFAEKHNLTLEIHERDSKTLPKYYAHFSNSEIVHDVYFLMGVFGDGYTEEAAIRNYAKEISNQILVINAMGENRKEICVPVLTV